MPIPGVMAGALARRTKNAKIAILGRALPLLNNPLVVAEEFAMLDNITRAASIAGFVRGIGAEYHASGVNPAETHERFHEAHDLIIRAWTEPGPFAYEGKHYHFEYVNILAAALPEAAPADLDSVAGSRETIEWAVAPGSQVHLPADLQSGHRARALHADVSRHGGEATATRPPPSSSAGRCRSTSAETDEIARREAKPHVETFLNKLLRMPPRDAAAAGLYLSSSRSRASWRPSAA